MKQREIYLVPFPFSDFSGRKVRPVIVVSNDSFNLSSADVVVCAITSTLKSDTYCVPLLKADIVEGELHTACLVKVQSLLKVDKRLLLKKIGTLSPKKFTVIQEKLHDLFE